MHVSNAAAVTAAANRRKLIGSSPPLLLLAGLSHGPAGGCTTKFPQDIVGMSPPAVIDTRRAGHRLAAVPRGAPVGAEKNPLNLIRVMPAKGQGLSVPDISPVQCRYGVWIWRISRALSHDSGRAPMNKPVTAADLVTPKVTTGPIAGSRKIYSAPGRRARSARAAARDRAGRLVGRAAAAGLRHHRALHRQRRGDRRRAGLEARPHRMGQGARRRRAIRRPADQAGRQRQRLRQAPGAQLPQHAAALPRARRPAGHPA